MIAEARGIAASPPTTSDPSVTLGDVVKAFISGGTPSTKRPDLWTGTVAWTTSATIAEDDVILCSAQRYISEKGLEESASNLVPKGNLLVGTRVGVGKAVMNAIDIAISQDLTGLILDREMMDPLFTAYQFKTDRVRTFLNGRKRGTTIKGVSRLDLQELPLRCPPLSEQRAIAHTLQAVQQVIQARRRELALERERKAALMQHLFAFGIERAAMQHTEIGQLPSKWETRPLAQVIRLVSGGTPSKQRPEWWQGSIPWVSP